MRRYNPPIDLDPDLILDPTRPLPAGLSLKKRKLVAEMREAYQWAMRKRAVKAKLNSPEAIAEAMLPLVAPLTVEHLWAVPLDSHGRMSAEPSVIAKGSRAGVEVSVPEIMRAMLMAYAQSFVLLHNHPSGDPTPSAADHAVTRLLVAAGRTMQVPLVDHVVISSTGAFVSLRREAPDLFR